MGKDSASLFAGIRRSSLWSLLEDSGETSFSNRNEPFRFEEEEPPSDTEFSQYHGSAETERATCAPTWFPLAVSFADFFGGKEIGPPEATGQGGRIAQASGESAARSENRPLRRGRKQDEGFSRCGATPFLLAEKKRGKETAKGNLVGAHVAHSISAEP